MLTSCQMQPVRRSLFQPCSSGSSSVHRAFQPHDSSSIDLFFTSQAGLPELPPPLVEIPQSSSAEISFFHYNSGFIADNSPNMFPLHQQEQFFVPDELDSNLFASSGNWIHSPAAAAAAAAAPVAESTFPPPPSGLLADPTYLSFLEHPPLYVNYLTDAHKRNSPPPPIPRAQVPALRNTSDSSALAYERPLKRACISKGDQVSSNSSSLSSPFCVSIEKTKVQRALSSSLKERAKAGTQSAAAKERRERISERLKTLQNLVPNGSKVDLVTMLEKAINYVKFMQLQIEVLTTDQYWPTQASKEQQQNTRRSTPVEGEASTS